MESILYTHTGDTKLVSQFLPERDFSRSTVHPQAVQTIAWTLENSSTDIPVKAVFVPCDNPDNIIDQATAELLDSSINLTVLPLLELFGVTANVINCVVFARQGLKDRINLCIFSLAVADMSFLLSVFAAKFYSFLGLFDEDLGEYWSVRHLGVVLSPMMGTMSVCNLMTLIISLERCICVMSPFKAKKFLKTRHMLVVIVTMAVYVLGVYSLLNFKYVTIHVTDPVTNASRWVSGLGDFYLEHRLVIDVLYNHLLLLTTPCLSVVVVVVATSLTVTNLSQKMAWRHESAASVRKEDSLVKRELGVTKMLVVVCVMYVVTMTPSVTQRFFRTLVAGYLPSGKYCNLFSVLQTVVHVCEVANSSLNFIIYFAMGSRFRSTLRELFGCRGPVRKTSTPADPQSSINSTCHTA